MELFGERLKKIRKEKKLSQAALADKLGVHRTAITQWENGLKTPSLSSIEKLSDVMGVSVDYLLGNDIEPSADELMELLYSLPKAKREEYIKLMKQMIELNK